MWLCYVLLWVKYLLTVEFSDREDEERQRKLEQEIIEGRKRRQALRAERTRSLSPEKRTSVANFDNVNTDSFKTLSDARNIPSLPAKSESANSKLTKAEEIKKTIEAIAGPTGTLPLFPSASNAASKQSPSENGEKEEKHISKPVKASVKSLKPSPFSKSEKHGDQDVFKVPNLSSVLKNESHTKSKSQIESEIFAAPILKSTTSPNGAHKKDAHTEEFAPFANVKLKSIVDSSAVKDKGSKETKKQELLLSKNKHVNGDAEKNNVDENQFVISKLKSTTTTKPSPKSVPPKPRSLSSQKAPQSKSLENDSDDNNDTKAEKAEKSGIKPSEKKLETWNDKTEEKPEENSALKEEPKVIAPIPSSATTGLKSFQITKEHNTHNQMNSVVNGRVPMPGMAPTLQPPVRPQLSTPSTPPPLDRTRSSFVSPSRQSILSGPKFSPSTVDLRTSSSSISPAGSFLASRSSHSISISRPASPSKGGFVQSAMLKRESTIFRSQPDSGNIFDGIALPSLTDRLSPSRSIYRHGRTQSATTIDTNSLGLSTGPFGRPLHDGPNAKFPRAALDDEKLLSQSVYEFPSKAGGLNTNGDADEDDLQFENFKRSLVTPSKSPSHLTEDSSPLHTNPSGSGLKHTDTRRWSPTRQTWLGNALKKTSQQSSNALESSPSLNNRVPTFKSSLPKPAGASSFIAEKPVFSKPPEVPPSRSANSPRPDTFKSDLEKTDNRDDVNEGKDESTVTDYKDSPSLLLSRNPESPHKLSPLPEKKYGLARSSTSITRSASVRPNVPQKPDFGASISGKPELPSDALAKLRALRSGVSQSPITSQKSADTNSIKPLSQRTNPQSIASRPTRASTTRAGLKPVSYLVDSNAEIEDEFNHYNPPLLSRPSVFDTTEEDQLSPSKATSRKKVVSKHASPLPPVPDQLKNKTQSADSAADAEDPVMNARRVLFGPNAAEKAQKKADDKLYSSPHIPSVLNKKTAKSFATDLSAALQRGKPLVAMKDSGKSFSPSFEGRMGGLTKAHTFDTSDMSRGARADSFEVCEPSKVELTHMTKGRAKGPRGRRLPKTVSGTSTPTGTRNSENSRLKTVHQRQRSRSLSPGQVKKLNAAKFSLQSPVPVPHRSLPTPPTTSSHSKPNKAPPVLRERYSFESDSDDDIPDAPPSRQSLSGDDPALLIPKQRKQLPTPPTHSSSKSDVAYKLYLNKTQSASSISSSIPSALTPGEGSPVFGATDNSFSGPGALGRAESTMKELRPTQNAGTANKSLAEKSFSSSSPSQKPGSSESKKPPRPVKPRQLSAQQK